MPKQLINTVGLLLVLGIIAAATFLVALPIYLQSVGADADSRAVASQNANTQASIDALAAQNVGSVQDGADHLRQEIPARAELDSVSALIASAAAKSGVTVVSITPGSPIDADAADASDGVVGGDTTGTTTEDVGASTDAGAATGRLRIPIEFQVSTTDLDAALEFIDTLREGPRLVGNIAASYSGRGGIVYLNLTADAFMATSS
ncbi:hypothetical protein ASD65_00330 [Microbacterium sp. Root61]|uniref:hypothetical protein n=1 Tax=Microbacterium sp. Root61 TaxID=1736570 RepID=UPI0006FFFE5A|nr:hypothetical protein [Microbacterium sp. Root61]KRA23036.1 hypothetical protein ASD65_00330 [Microbacterium sp. Root61]